jgi:ribosomal protein S18 acetylase RimI-like enzyme
MSNGSTRSPSDTIIRPMEAADCPAVAAIHCEALSDDLFPRLGQRLLSETFYPMVWDNESIAAYVAEENSKITGFLVLERDPGGIVSLVRSRFAAFGPAILKAIIFDLGIAFEIACATVFKSQAWLNGAPASAGASEISFIAVASGARGGGHGERLVNAAVADAFSLERDLIVRTALPGAGRFYEKCGFVNVGSERRCQRVLQVLALKHATIRTAVPSS